MAGINLRMVFFIIGLLAFVVLLFLLAAPSLVGG